jgi:hypothetical protein
LVESPLLFYGFVVVVVELPLLFCNFGTPLLGAALANFLWHLILCWGAHACLYFFPFVRGVYDYFGGCPLAGVLLLANGRSCLSGVPSHPVLASSLIGLPLDALGAKDLIGVPPQVGDAIQLIGVASKQTNLH